jgi:hypothetical protein
MEEAERLAQHLIREHRKEVPHYLSGKDEQTVSRWKLDIEKLLRIDGKSAEDIEAVISWVKRPDNFWFANIISGSKLMEKYEQLYSDMVMEGRSQRTKQKKTPSSLKDKKSLEGLDSW